MSGFERILVANRGEIAIRVLRAAYEMGKATVAVFAEEDHLSLHRFKADESYRIGEGRGPVTAYLAVDDIIRVAVETRSDAIHPGYGFLSESPEFAEACAAAGIAFIGPRPETLRLLGDKVSARAIAARAGVPTVPATDALPADPAAALALVRAVGFPGMLKASWGGGGRGMRIVETEDAFEAALLAARREADAAFGKDDIYLERFIRRARHLEVQVLADGHGRMVHLFGARLLGAAAQPEDRGMRARPRPQPGGARCAHRIRPRHRARGGLSQRGHGGVPARYRHRALSFHRGQSAYPGGAHRHRAGDRHRPGAGSNPHCRRRGHRGSPGRRLPAAGRYFTARPCRAVPDHDRGSARPLHSRLRADHRLPGRHRLRHSPRWRHRLHGRGHHPPLRFAAGEGHRLGVVAGRRDRPHAACAAGVPNPGRRDQYRFSRTARERRGVPARPGDDPLHRRQSGASRLRPARATGRAACCATSPRPPSTAIPR